jgi:hypothetical protein
VVDAQLRDRDEFIVEGRERLEQAQQKYKMFYDRHHRELKFAPGQWAWLRFLHRSITSLSMTGKGKLGPKFFGPFNVLERIWDVAYRLELPAGVKLHDVFHVGLLKPDHVVESAGPSALPTVRHERTCLEPTSVVKSRFARGCHKVLVQWVGLSVANT